MDCPPSEFPSLGCCGEAPLPDCPALMYLDLRGNIGCELTSMEFQGNCLSNSGTPTGLHPLRQRFNNDPFFCFYRDGGGPSRSYCGRNLSTVEVSYLDRRDDVLFRLEILCQKSVGSRVIWRGGRSAPRGFIHNFPGEYISDSPTVYTPATLTITVNPAP